MAGFFDGRGRPAGGPLGTSLAGLRRDLARQQPLISDDATRVAASSWLSVTEDEAQDRPPSPPRLSEFVRLCTRGRLQPLLTAHGISHPSYNYFEDFEANAAGPWDTAPNPARASSVPAWRLLGADVGFPIGVPASVLTTSAEWIDYYARQGFNILTYKTVRSGERKALPGPNWVFLQNLQAPLPVDGVAPAAIGDPSVWPSSRAEFSMANSFGVPSFAPDVWVPDVARALRVLQPHQMLLVSVMGNYEGLSGEAMVEDFAEVAGMAEGAGARAIELNISCPNTIDFQTGLVKDTLICESPEDTARIVAAVRRRIRTETRLVVKLGFMPKSLLRAVIAPIVRDGLVDGVSGINTIQMEVRTPEGLPTFEGTLADAKAPRLPAGVSGVAIREFGLQFVRWLAEIKAEDGLEFDVIGMGGVMSPRDVAAYLRAGAAAVQAATAAFFNPGLPAEIVASLGGIPVSETELAAESRVLELLADGPRQLSDIARAVEEFFPRELVLAEKARAILGRLEDDGLVAAVQDRGRLLFRTASEPVAV